MKGQRSSVALSKATTFTLMDDDALMDLLDKEIKKDEACVVAEIPITAGQLHKIASGTPMTVGYFGEIFAVRFLIQSSFKSPVNNYVIHNFAMQVIAVGKNNAMRREEMAAKVRLEKGNAAEKQKKIQPAKPSFETIDAQKDVF